MRAFTGQASLALQNARLFEETERRFQEFAALYETSNALSADNDLNTLLKDIVEHAATLLNTNTGAMYLYNRVKRKFGNSGYNNTLHIHRHNPAPWRGGGRASCPDPPTNENRGLFNLGRTVHKNMMASYFMPSLKCRCSLGET